MSIFFVERITITLHPGKGISTMNDRIVQMPDSILNKTLPLFSLFLLSCLFPLWGCAAALNDILITQFKSVFSFGNFASALVQKPLWRLFFNCYSASLVIKKTSYKKVMAILIGLTLYIVGCTLFFPAMRWRPTLCSSRRFSPVRLA